MSACRRFDSEGSLLWERGQAPDAHVASCADCLGRWRTLDRLGSALRAEPPVALPAPEWKARVLAGVDAASPGQPAVRVERSRRAWMLWTVPTVALGAIGLLFVRARKDNDELREPLVDFAVVAPEGRRVRGATGTEPTPTAGLVGDRLKVFGSVPAGVTWEVRVHKDGRELVFRCPPGCGLAPGHGLAEARFEVDIPLAAVGRYQAVVAVARAPLPPPADGQAADLARIEKAGGRTRRLPVIEVR